MDDNNDFNVIHQSGLSLYDRCPRAYYYNYAYNGIGVVRTEPNIDLTLGIAVHQGVGDMIAEFNATSGGLTWDYVKVCGNHAGMVVDNAWQDYIKELKEQPNPGMKENWGQAIEIANGLTLVFYLIAMAELVKKYRFVGVEVPVESWITPRLLMVTRIDVVLEERESKDRYLVNFKTAKQIDDRLESKHSHDLQSITEVLLYEDYMKGLKKSINDSATAMTMLGVKKENVEKIKQLASKVVETVAGTKIIYLFKGYHKKVFDSSGNDTGRVDSYSPLVRGWKKVGEDGEVKYAFSYEVSTVDGKVSRLGSSWKPFKPYKEYPGGTAQWVMDIWQGKIQPEVNGKEKLEECIKIGWDWQKRDEEIEEEREEIIARWGEICSLQQMGEKYYRKHRHSCDYPLRCQYQCLCFEGEQVFGDGGRFKYRVPHHEKEREKLKDIIEEAKKEG